LTFQQQNEIGEYENSSLVTNWLLKSDIKNIDGSEDIIKAICADEVSSRPEDLLTACLNDDDSQQDDENNLAKSLETNCSQIYGKMFALEKELNLLFTATINNINNNNNENSE
jgi:hypothetical protein